MALLLHEPFGHHVGDVGGGDEFLAGHAAEAVVGVVIKQPYFVRPEKTGGTWHAIDDHMMHPVEDVPHGAHGRFTEVVHGWLKVCKAVSISRSKAAPGRVAVARIASLGICQRFLP